MFIIMNHTLELHLFHFKLQINNIPKIILRKVANYKSHWIYTVIWLKSKESNAMTFLNSQNCYNVYVIYKVDIYIVISKTNILFIVTDYREKILTATICWTTTWMTFKNLQLIKLIIIFSRINRALSDLVLVNIVRN